MTGISLDGDAMFSRQTGHRGFPDTASWMQDQQKRWPQGVAVGWLRRSRQRGHLRLEKVLVCVLVVARWWIKW